MKLGLRSFLLSFAAVLALGSFQAIAATPASALPYWSGGLPASFAFNAKESSIEASGAGAMTVKCQTIGTLSSSWNGAATITGNLNLKGCTGQWFGIPMGACSSSGAASGEILTANLSATLVYLSKAIHEVGILFSQSSGAPIASFKCGGESVVLRGTVLGKITPVGTLANHFPIAAKGSGGVQELTQYENEKGEKFSSKAELSINGAPSNSADLNATGFEVFSNPARTIAG